MGDDVQEYPLSQSLWQQEYPRTDPVPKPDGDGQQERQETVTGVGVPVCPMEEREAGTGGT